MKTEQPILITTIPAAADLSAKKNYFIGFDGNLCGAATKALGVLNANTDSGEQAPVMVEGIALVLLGGTVSVGNKIETDASGKAVAFSSGVVNGYALDAGSSDDLIRVLLK